MLDKKVEKELNAQLNRELFSSHLYLAMSAYFEAINFGGMAHWLREQAREEMLHAMKFYKFIAERDGRITIDKLDKPQEEWKSPLDAFEAAYKHEQSISQCIHDLIDFAEKAGDKPTVVFLSWFVNEQVEEESSARHVVDTLRLVGESTHGLIMLDRELARRGQ